MSNYLIIMNLLVFAGVITTCNLYADVTFTNYTKFMFCMLVVTAFAGFFKLESIFLPLGISAVYTFILPILVGIEKLYDKRIKSKVTIT